MSINLLNLTKIDQTKLSKVLPTNLATRVISIELGWYASRDVYSGKVMYNAGALDTRRFIVPPKQFYILHDDGPAMTLITEGFGTVVTKPSDLIDGRYDFLRFHASMHYDACALMDLEDVRKNLNLTYQFNVGDLNNETVIIGDNKKVRTTIRLMDKHDPEYAKAEQYAVLGKLVVLHRQSKNSAPSNTFTGLLTATGILYRLNHSSNREQIESATAIGCLAV